MGSTVITGISGMMNTGMNGMQNRRRKAAPGRIRPAHRLPLQTARLLPGDPAAAPADQKVPANQGEVPAVPEVLEVQEISLC